MRSVKTGIVLFLVLIALFTSCSQIGEDETLVPVYLCAVNKALSVSSDIGNQTLAYQYTAVPNFSGNVKGRVDSYSNLTFKDGVAGLGYFSQGSWTFSVVGKTQSGKIIYQGNTTVFLKGNQTNTVVVELSKKQETGKGTLSINFTGPKLGNNNFALALRYRKSDSNVFTTNTIAWDATAENQVIRYTGSMSLDAGSYELNFIYSQDGKEIGGDTVSAEIFAGETTSVTGNIESGVAVAGQIRVNLSGSGSVFSGSFDTYPGRKTVCYWKGAGEANSYKWSLNGTEVDCHTSSYTFCEQIPGKYTLVCVATSSSKVQTSTYTITVQQPNQIQFSEMRAGNLSSGQICIGYRDSSGSEVSFPYSYNGDRVAGASPSAYGLTPIVITPSAEVDVEKLHFFEVEGDYTQFGTERSVVNSKGGFQENYTLTEAVFKVNPQKCDLTVCQSLKTVVFANGVTEIPSLCCFNSSSLTTVYIAKSVTTVNTTAFSGCGSLSAIYVQSGCPALSSLQNKYGDKVKTSGVSDDIFR